MTINRVEKGRVTVFRISGDIDQDGVNELRVVLRECVKTRRARLVMNLSETGYVSFMGVGVLLERKRQLQALGGDLKLAGMNLFAQRVLQMAGVSKMFAVFDTEAQALEGFREAA